jgi:hypothetical protein
MHRNLINIHFLFTLMVQYFAKVVQTFPSSKGWEIQQIGIFEHNNTNNIQIGSYLRNYHTFYNTFFAFKIDSEWFALYSPNYMETRVMKLIPTKDQKEPINNIYSPSDIYDFLNHCDFKSNLRGCLDLGGESIKEFCPTDYYIPPFILTESNDEVDITSDEIDDPYISPPDSAYPLRFRSFGFIGGCIWGDDTSCKIQMIDLEKAKEGIISRQESLGYLWIPNNLKLKDSIDMTAFSELKQFDIAIPLRFSMENIKAQKYAKFSLDYLQNLLNIWKK